MKEIDPHLPINKLASFVVSKVNHDQKPLNTNGLISSMAPLPTVQFTGPKKDDLTGRKVGYFTVVGFSAWRSKDKDNATRWVVKCRCGRYQILTTKAVKKAHESNRCIECRQTYFISKLANKLTNKIVS